MQINSTKIPIVLFVINNTRIPILSIFFFACLLIARLHFYFLQQATGQYKTIRKLKNTERLANKNPFIIFSMLMLVFISPGLLP